MKFISYQNRIIFIHSLIEVRLVSKNLELINTLGITCIKLKSNSAAKELSRRLFCWVSSDYPVQFFDMEDNVKNAERVVKLN